MRVLVVGGGGREHALVWKISQSPKVKKIYCAPGNAGTEALAENVDIAADQVEALADFAERESVDLCVVGPEQALALGIVDRFRERGLRAFGPSAQAARLEGSKVFCKNLMRDNGVPTADYKVFDDPAAARAYLQSKDRIIVKADGLAAGKGAYVCQTREEALLAVEEIMEKKIYGSAGDQVVIEEFLEGREVSFLAFADGKSLIPMEPAQDHKAAYDGDKGPNTGGMGAYSPAPLLTPELQGRVMAEIMYPTVEAMAREGRPYRGVLYAGLMIDSAGPKVLEFNARFGDPETQPLMMRMKSDLIPILDACIDGTLKDQRIQWSDESAVCVVMAAEGYPGKYARGKEISGLQEAGEQSGFVVFHAGTSPSEGRVLTNGGRVLGATALGKDLPAAIDRAYEAVGKIKWDGLHFRKDIGRRPA